MWVTTRGDTNLNPLPLPRIAGLVVLGGKKHCVVTRNQGARVTCEVKRGLKPGEVMWGKIG